MHSLLITHGYPNLDSEGASKEAFIFISDFIEKKVKVSLIVIENKKNFSANIDNTKFKRQLKKKFKNKVNLYTLKVNNNFFYSFLKFSYRFIFCKPENFFETAKKKEIETLIEKINPDFFINFFNQPAASTYEVKNIPFYNYCGIPPHLVEPIRQKNLIYELNFENLFKLINSLIYNKLVKKIYKKMFWNAEINFLSSPDTYSFFKKNSKGYVVKTNNITKNSFKIKNLTKKNCLIMIGNLKATFTHEGLIELSENLINELVLLRKKIKFNLKIIGHFEPTSKIKEKLNYKWVNFTGYVPDLKKEFSNANALIVTNKTKLSTRTRIINAMQAKLPVITYANNIFFNKEFKHKKNILVANDEKNFSNLIHLILTDRVFAKKLANNAYLTVQKNYNYKKIVGNITKEMLNHYSNIKN